MRQKVTKTLFSVNPEEYPNIEVEFEVYDTPAQILKEATEGSAIYAKKTVHVKARPAQEGEIVDTNPRLNYQGKVYTFSEVKRTITKEEAESGMMIISNPDGEQYAQTRAKFESKYNVAGTNPDGSLDCEPKGGLVCFKQIKDNVTVNVWGSPWFVTAGGYVAGNEDDCYPITNEAFDKTYEVQKDKNLNLG